VQEPVLEAFCGFLIFIFIQSGGEGQRGKRDKLFVAEDAIFDCPRPSLSAFWKADS
jgi:hypothetical protein